MDAIYASHDSNPSRIAVRTRGNEWREIFDTVTSCYVTLRAFPPIAAKNFDSDSTQRTKAWTPEIGGFLADVERVTEEALGDNLVMQAAWFALASGEGETVPKNVRNDVYRLCGKLYKSRGLSPARYFRRSLRTAGFLTTEDGE